MVRCTRPFVWLTVLLLAFAAPASAQTSPVTVFAAVSLKDVLEEAGKAFAASGSQEVRFSFASSALLAKQIENGAPADLFASADLKWMDYLVEKDRIQRASVTPLLGNHLVVAAPASSPLTTLDWNEAAFGKAMGAGRLAVAEVTAVPAGIYAKQALQKLGLWGVVENRLAQTDNVRAALVFVDRGEVPLAIVYATDALADPKVKVVAQFPSDSHRPIIYPFALTSRAEGEGPKQFLAFLKGPVAKAIFEKAGFPVLHP
jgi:molybdate transport system substrate-binding protein